MDKKRSKENINKKERETIPEDYDDLVEKYRKKLEEKLGGKKQIEKRLSEKIISKEYETFKRELLPVQMTLYEKACGFSEKVFKISPDKKKKPSIEKDIAAIHLQVTPTGVYSFSLLGPLLLIVFGVLLSMALPALFGNEPSMFFIMASVLTGVALMYPFQKLPSYLANSWRLQASTQMVLCIFYLVTYMRHTSNLERALEFAADHLSGPLALDLKKVLWDVENGKYETVKDTMDAYLQTW